MLPIYKIARRRWRASHSKANSDDRSGDVFLPMWMKGQEDSVSSLQRFYYLLILLFTIYYLQKSWFEFSESIFHIPYWDFSVNNFEELNFREKNPIKKPSYLKNPGKTQKTQ